MNRQSDVYFDRNTNYLNVRYFRLKQTAWFGLNYAAFVGAVLSVCIGIALTLEISIFKPMAAAALLISSFNLVSRDP